MRAAQVARCGAVVLTAIGTMLASACFDFDGYSAPDPGAGGTAGFPGGSGGVPSTGGVGASGGAGGGDVGGGGGIGGIGGAGGGGTGGSGCAPKSCADQQIECGSATDLCGKAISCGECSTGRTCAKGLCIWPCGPNSVYDPATCGSAAPYWCADRRTCTSAVIDCWTVTDCDGDGKPDGSCKCKLCFVTHKIHYALVVVMRERACLCLDLKNYHSEACA